MSTQQQRLWLNVGLLLLLVALSLGALWSWKTLETNAETQALLPLSKQDIKRIVIERYLTNPKPERIVLERQGKQWFMREPWAVEANPVKLTQLLTLAHEPVLAEYPLVNQPLQEFGLEPLNTRLYFNEFLLGFGASNPVSNQRYIQVGTQLKLVAEVVASVVEGDALELVARTLIPTHTEVVSIQLADQPPFTESSIRANWRSASAIRLERFSAETTETAAQTKSVKLILSDQTVLHWRALVQGQDLILSDLGTGIRYILPKSFAPQLLGTAM